MKQGNVDKKRSCNKDKDVLVILSAAIAAFAFTMLLVIPAFLIIYSLTNHNINRNTQKHFDRQSNFKINFQKKTNIRAMI